MNIFGRTLVFKNINPQTNNVRYTTSITNKLQDGTTEYMQYDIQFPKGTELHNKSVINITKGFLTFWTGNNGVKNPKIVVQEYTLEGATEPQITQTDIDQFNEARATDLPF